MLKFTGAARDSYPQDDMPDDAAPLGDGPWGEAVRYWLHKKKLRQAALVRGTGLTANTISGIVRGLPTQTRSLDLIARWLKVPLAAVLVSPLKQGDDKTQRQRTREALAEALVTLETGHRLDEETIAWAKRLQALKGRYRDEALVTIENLEQAQKQRQLGRKRGGPPK